MPAICSYFNPYSNEFDALNKFENLSCRNKLGIGLITTLFVCTIILIPVAIPVFRYFVGRCTVNPVPTLTIKKTQAVFPQKKGINQNISKTHPSQQMQEGQVHPQAPAPIHNYPMPQERSRKPLIEVATNSIERFHISSAFPVMKKEEGQKDRPQCDICSDPAWGIKVDNSIVSILHRRKINVLKTAIRKIDSNTINNKDETVIKVRELFVKKLSLLRNGKYTPIGDWFHAAQGPAAVGIMQTGKLTPSDEQNLYGKGVYLSSSPESSSYRDTTRNYLKEKYEGYRDAYYEIEDQDWSGYENYGMYVFAIDNLAFFREGETESIYIPQDGRVWLLTNKRLPVNAQTAILAVPENHVEKTRDYIEKSIFEQNPEALEIRRIEIISHKMLKAMLYYYGQAEQEQELFLHKGAKALVSEQGREDLNKYSKKNQLPLFKWFIQELDKAQ